MASTIYYDVGSGGACVLGHKYDHNATIVHFSGFTMVSESNTLYFKLQTNKNNYLIPLIDYEWNVTQPVTLEAGEFRGQLMEVSVNDEGVSETIQSSSTFKAVILRSISDGYEITDPTLDLWMDKVKVLYDKYVSGGEYLDNIVAEVKEIQAQINATAKEVSANAQTASAKASEAAASASASADSASQASGYMTSAKESAATATTKANESATSASAAKTYASNAEASNTSAKAAQVAAESAKSSAQTSAATATSKAKEASDTAANFSDVTVPAAVSAINSAKETAISAVDAEASKGIASIQAVEDDIAENYPKYDAIISEQESLKEEIATCLYIDTEGYICLKEA